MDFGVAFLVLAGLAVAAERHLTAGGEQGKLRESESTYSRNSRKRCMVIQELELSALVKAGIFSNKTEAIKEALRLLFVTRPQLSVEAAIQLYKEEEVTLGRAAEMAGITRWEFETLLADRGIERSVTCDPAEDLDRQVERLHQRA